MRELKFRAWDKQTRDMLEFFAPSMEFYNKRLNRYRDFFDRHIIQMQYSGLKDSGGKEIYDGDILEVKDSNGVICRTAVTQIEGAFVIGKWYPQAPTSVEHVIYNGEWEQVEVDIEDHEFLGVVLKHHLEFMVVGNIFEHPYLLEAKGNESRKTFQTTS